MPLPALLAPFAALMPQGFYGLLAWVGAAWTAGKISNLDFADFKREVLGSVVQAAAVHSFNLDPDDPFSDESLAGAVSERIQVPLRSIRDRDMIEEDLLKYVSIRIGDRTGLYLTNPKDIDVVRADVFRFAGKKISEHTGIPLSDVTNRETTIAELKEWGITQAYSMVGGDARAAIDMFTRSGVNVDTIVGSLNQMIEKKPGAEPLDAKAVAMAMLHSSMAQQIARIATRGALQTMKTKRQLQMQAATMRFRERNAECVGGSSVYQRLEDFQRRPRQRREQ